MSEQIIKIQEQSSHWYDQQGNPRHDANLRTARKEQLLPSVTSIIRDAYPQSFYLKNWIHGQIVLAAATTPRIPDETDDQWVGRVMEASNEKRDQSAKWGLDFHQEVENALRNQAFSTHEYLDRYVEKFKAWSRENIREVIGLEGVVTQPTLGYAGRYDLKLRFKDGRIGLGDIKTRDVKEGTKPQFYPEQPIQLVAYGHAMNAGERPDFMFSLIVNRLKPEPPYMKIYTQKELDVADRRWAACLNLWQEMKGYRPKINYDGENLA